MVNEVGVVIRSPHSSWLQKRRRHVNGVSHVRGWCESLQLGSILPVLCAGFIREVVSRECRIAGIRWLMAWPDSEQTLKNPCNRIMPVKHLDVG